MRRRTLVQKYQAASCQQLWAERAAAQSRPRSPAEQRAIQLLHQDAGARAEFIGRIAAPIANKMFECGMIPDRGADGARGASRTMTEEVKP